MFSQLRSIGDSLFRTLPPPSPQLPLCPMCQKPVENAAMDSHMKLCPSGGSFASLAVSRPSHIHHSVHALPVEAPVSPRSPVSPASPVVNMGSYMESGGCFGSSSTVQVSRNSSFHETKVSDVKPGDLVKVVGAKRFGNQGQNVAKVRCVVMYPCDPSIPLIGLPGGCLLTKSHPVRIDGVWRKPQDIGIPAANPSDHVWNFVLEVNHILLVNGMECCTLGHGFQEEGVFHEYWGSRVLDDLAKLPGWAQGRVMAFSQKGPDGHTSMVVSKYNYSRLQYTLYHSNKFTSFAPSLLHNGDLAFLTPVLIICGMLSHLSLVFTVSCTRLFHYSSKAQMLNENT